MYQSYDLYEALFHHCSSNLFESSDVSALDQQVLVAEVLLSSSSTVLVDVSHDLVQLFVNRIVLIYSVACVLAHLDAGACNAASVSSLSVLAPSQ